MSVQGVVLHIGGAKTASTTLQNGVFLQSPNLHHFGEYGDGVTSQDEENIILSIFGLDEPFFSWTSAQETFAKHFQIANGRKMVFSSADALSANRPYLVARRLKRLVGPAAKVLLVIRNQQHALSSYYSGHGAWLKPAPNPYYRSFVKFDDWFEFESRNSLDSKLMTFSYWEQLLPFIETFGRENVHVVCFEDMVNANLTVWNELGDILGIKAEKALHLFQSQHSRIRPTLRQLSLGRICRMGLPFFSTPDVRSFQGRFGRWLGNGNRAELSWKPEQLHRIALYYSPGNILLQQEFNLTLNRWGYPGAD